MITETSTPSTDHDRTAPTDSAARALVGRITRLENGPDLEVYLVPGADQVSLPDGSIHLGALKGNIGDQNYELPAGTDLAPGAYTALVWCEAFSVEFVGATILV